MREKKATYRRVTVSKKVVSGLADGSSSITTENPKLSEQSEVIYFKNSFLSPKSMLRLVFFSPYGAKKLGSGILFFPGQETHSHVSAHLQPRGCRTSLWGCHRVVIKIKVTTQKVLFFGCQRYGQRDNLLPHFE